MIRASPEHTLSGRGVLPAKHAGVKHTSICRTISYKPETLRGKGQTYAEFAGPDHRTRLLALLAAFLFLSALSYHGLVGVRPHLRFALFTFVVSLVNFYFVAFGDCGTTGVWAKGVPCRC